MHNEDEPEPTVECRPETKLRARPCTNGPPEEPALVCLNRAGDPSPATADEPLQTERALAVVAPHLAPEHRRPAGSRDLRERQRKGLRCGLREAPRGEQAALPARRTGVVAEQELDEHFDAGGQVRTKRRVVFVARLPDQGDAELPVRGIRLVAVLRQPQ